MESAAALDPDSIGKTTSPFMAPQMRMLMPQNRDSYRDFEWRPFQAPWWLRNAHAQTLASTIWTGLPIPYRAVSRQISLKDGDAVVVHDDCPPTWRPGEQVALLMHGLSGSHRSPLLVRLASKLSSRGVRVFRWDFRGCGAGRGLARFPYHAGCSSDLSTVVTSVIEWCRNVPGTSSDRTGDSTGSISSSKPFLSLFGVSLSGNILLKYLGESLDPVPSEVDQAIVVNPPIDLSRSVDTLKNGLNRLYDRHFVGALLHDVEQRRRLLPDAPMPASLRRLRGLRDFDDWYTAPMSGYATASAYYDRCSALQFMPNIRIPTTVITSRDDPMVPVQMFTESVGCWSSVTRLVIAEGGGHVGYIARRSSDPDPFWLDWRIVELVTRNRPN